MGQQIIISDEPTEGSLFGDTTVGLESMRQYKVEIPAPILNYLGQIIREEIRLMEARVMQRIDLLEQRIIESERSGVNSEEVILLRSIPREQAKEEIMKLLDESDKLYYSDIAEMLRLDLKEVVEIIEELEAEGKVGEAE